ncbi:MAG TPA: hypothetical protein DEA08_04465 [Planctomycetes bacterium]|nr:hypothetical protein [Planctomycetota bacterium]
MHEFDIHLLADLCYVVLALFMLLVAKLTLNLCTPFDLDDELSSRDNPAFGISLIGYYLGVVIVFLGAIYQEESMVEAEAAAEGGAGAALNFDHFFVDLGVDALWVLGAILLLNAARVLLDVVVLRGFSAKKEIVEDRNAGVGAVEFGTYVSSALVVAGAISGQGGGWHTTLVFFLLGMGALTGFALAYQQLVSYDLLRELEADNVAAGVAYGGNLIALGVVILRGSGGSFTSWEEHLERFAIYLVFALLLLTVGRFVVDRAFFPGRTLHEEIAQDRNLNAGYLEGGLLLGLASIVAFAT